MHRGSLKWQSVNIQSRAAICPAQRVCDLYDFANLIQEKRESMGACSCTYTRDEEKNCDGTHKVVKAVKADLAEKLEANGFPHAAEYVRNN
jgi:hypothetical protein